MRLALGAFGPLLISLSVSAQTDPVELLQNLGDEPLPYINCITDASGTECREAYFCEHPPEWIRQRDGSVIIKTPCQSWTFTCGGYTAASPGDSCAYGSAGNELRIEIIKNGFVMSGVETIIKYRGVGNE